VTDTLLNLGAPLCIRGSLPVYLDTLDRSACVLCPDHLRWMTRHIIAQKGFSNITMIHYCSLRARNEHALLKLGETTDELAAVGVETTPPRLLVP
jgi:hypothetical protein